MNAAFLLLGADARQASLAALLAKEYSVQTLGIPGREDAQEPCADRVVLPVPSFLPDGSPRWSSEEALQALLRPGITVFGGALGVHTARFPAVSRWVDLLEDPVTAAENAVLTADAALLLMMQHSRQSLQGMRCRVIGCGRIGGLLCPRLRALGASVELLSTSPEKRALAAAHGYPVFAPEGLDPESPAWYWNTAPAQLISTPLLARIPEQSVWMELASAPGGLPDGERFCFRTLPAGGLPGRLLPVSAGAVLYRAIKRAM